MTAVKYIFIQMGDRSSFERIKDCLPMIEITVILLLIGICNLHLVTGTFSDSLIFYPAGFFSGRWWLAFTHPFVHVSWYHLFLDVTAFVMLYRGLEDMDIIKKILIIMACLVSSIAVPLIGPSSIQTSGLCGLSGVAHGLMVFCVTDMILTEKGRTAGLSGFVLIISKTVFELYTGHAFFSFMHAGMCGSPVVSCHAGGVVGGLMISLLHVRRRISCRSLNE